MDEKGKDQEPASAVDATSSTRPLEASQSSSSSKKPQPMSMTVEVKLTAPTWARTSYDKIQKTTQAAKQNKKMTLTVGVFGVTMCSALAGFSYAAHNSITVSSSGIVDIVKETPTYEVLEPDDKSIEKLGGWSRISPPDRDPVYAYADTIDQIRVTVSQQPLPNDLRANPTAQVEKLAKDFSASDKVESAGMTIYVGTSSRGPQSVIFSKNGLLILIKSSAKIDNKQWIEYAKNLR